MASASAFWPTAVVGEADSSLLCQLQLVTAVAQKALLHGRSNLAGSTIFLWLTFPSVPLLAIHFCRYSRFLEREITYYFSVQFFFSNVRYLKSSYFEGDKQNSWKNSGVVSSDHTCFRLKSSWLSIRSASLPGVAMTT